MRKIAKKQNVTETIEEHSDINTECCVTCHINLQQTDLSLEQFRQLLKMHLFS